MYLIRAFISFIVQILKIMIKHALSESDYNLTPFASASSYKKQCYCIVLKKNCTFIIDEVSRYGRFA